MDCGSRKLERDLSGNPIRFPGIVFDVTERRNAESALRTNRELLTSIIDKRRHSHLCENDRWQIILCNLRHAELLNRSPAKSLAKQMRN